MTDEQLETVEGYVEDRFPDTQVAIIRRRNKYHELNEDGNICCTVDGTNSETVSLETAIRQWYEPCQNDRCKRMREDGSIPDTVDGKVAKKESEESRFFGIDGWQDKEKLYQAYWEYYWSSNEIGNWVGVHQQRVRDVMREFGIPVRDVSTTNRIRAMKDAGFDHEQLKEHIGQPDPNESHSYKIEWNEIEAL